MAFFDKLLRAGEGKKVKALAGLVPEINALEAQIEVLSDDDLAAKTPEFRTRLDNGEHVDDLLIEAFAVTREAARRVIGQRPEHGDGLGRGERQVEADDCVAPSVIEPAIGPA